MGAGMNQKSQTKKIVIAIIAVMVMGLIVFGWMSKETNKTVQDINTQSNQQATESNEPKKTEYLSYQGEEGKTALELLKAQAEVEVKSSSLGDYVTSINGNDGGGSKFWMFFVDGKESTVGAGTYITKSNENIEWKLQ